MEIILGVEVIRECISIIFAYHSCAQRIIACLIASQIPVDIADSTGSQIANELSL